MCSPPQLHPYAQSPSLYGTGINAPTFRVFDNNSLPVPKTFLLLLPRQFQVPIIQDDSKSQRTIEEYTEGPGEIHHTKTEARIASKFEEAGKMKYKYTEEKNGNTGDISTTFDRKSEYNGLQITSFPFYSLQLGPFVSVALGRVGGERRVRVVGSESDTIVEVSKDVAISGHELILNVFEAFFLKNQDFSIRRRDSKSVEDRIRRKPRFIAVHHTSGGSASARVFVSAMGKKSIRCSMIGSRFSKKRDDTTKKANDGS
ncbi:hypothetical protein BT96DRAFT_938092 [Gymnopus androsaceus JB14]|uniref:Uncharacterized protein n=1 Tax=Gymnopus androsaceus JB14 TaxID=1447944 RepID=A0A6A4HWG3_9AGAR|nr:hypothetical protein BT96DRAFT_938092 [Gymnopus androsaceus JB14]